MYTMKKYNKAAEFLSDFVPNIPLIYIRPKQELLYLWTKEVTDITKEVKMKPVDSVYSLFLGNYGKCHSCRRVGPSSPPMKIVQCIHCILDACYVLNDLLHVHFIFCVILMVKTTEMINECGK